MKCTVRDLMGTLSQRTRTPEGFLSAPATIAAADNVQPYRARELGITDGDPNRILRLFRPKAEVFSADTIASFERKTLTIDHPDGGVDAANWKSVSCGDVHGIAPTDNVLVAKFLVRAEDAIAVVESNHKIQVSCGYDFDLVLTPGTFNGQAYDGIQTNIRGNHVAIVDAARGGPGLRIADRKTKGNTMKIRMADRALAGIALPGFNITVEDAGADAAQDAIDRHGKACDAAQKAYDTLAADKAAADAALKAANDAHTKAAADAAKLLADTKALIPTPEALQALVAEHSALVGDAATLAPEFKVEGLAVQAIRAGVVAAVIADDEDLKPIAEGILKASGQTDPTKASDATLKSVIAALVPMKAKATTGDDDITRARDRALAGDDDDKTVTRKATGDRAPKLFGREAMMYRESVLRGGPIEATK